MDLYTTLTSLTFAIVRTIIIKSIEYQETKSEKNFNINIFKRSAFTSFGFMWVSLTMFIMINDLITSGPLQQNPRVIYATNISAYIIPLLLDIIAGKLAKKMIVESTHEIATFEVKRALIFWLFTGPTIVFYSIFIYWISII